MGLKAIGTWFGREIKEDPALPDRTAVLVNRLDVRHARLQCPQCGAPINVVEHARVGEMVMLEPCGHQGSAQDLL